mgnify:CR=1 FL=1
MLDNQIIYGLIGSILNICFLAAMLIIIVFAYKKHLKIAPILLISGIVKLIAIALNYVMAMFLVNKMTMDYTIAGYAIINAVNDISMIVFLGYIANYFIQIRPEEKNKIDL